MEFHNAELPASEWSSRDNDKDGERGEEVHDEGHGGTGSQFE